MKSSHFALILVFIGTISHGFIFSIQQLAKMKANAIDQRPGNESNGHKGSDLNGDKNYANLNEKKGNSNEQEKSMDKSETNVAKLANNGKQETNNTSATGPQVDLGHHEAKKNVTKSNKEIMRELEELMMLSRPRYE